MGMARPGLRGAKGKLNLLAVDIADQIELRNPELIVLLETVKFKDLKADHDTMTSRMRGEPVYIDSADYSYTKRLRAWYLRAKDYSVFPQDLIGPRSPLDPDQCMDPGRTLVRKPKSGSVGTISASWRGGNKPVAYTNFPVLVQDEAEEELQHLRPHEAEKLHGLPPNCTAAPGLTSADRLRLIGGGWDVNVAKKPMAAIRRILENRMIAATLPSEVQDHLGKEACVMIVSLVASHDPSTLYRMTEDITSPLKDFLQTALMNITHPTPTALKALKARAPHGWRWIVWDTGANGILE